MADLFDIVADKMEQSAPPSQPPMSGWQRFRQGVRTGLEAIPLGIKQMGAETGEKLGMVSPETVEELRAQEGARRQMETWAATQGGRQDGMFNPARVGSFAAQAAPALLPGGAATTLPRAIGAGAAMGGLMGATQPLTKDESRLARTATGAAVGAVAPVIVKGSQKGIDWFLGSKTADAIIDSSLAKAGIKPTVKSGPEIERFQQQSRSAVKDIVKNKSNLVVDGDTGQLPQSVMGFSQAVDQTKDALFTEYNTLLQRASQAGGQGAAVDTAPILRSLEAIKADPAFATHGGKSAMFALNDLIQAYSSMPNLTLPQAQNFIKTLNRRLEAFYKNPTDAAVGEAYVNAEIASKLRSELDSVISRLEGPGYQDLKTRYGALSAMEDKVAKAAVKSTGKKTGFEDMLTDKYSGVKMMYGLATGKLPAIVAGGAVKALGWWQKGMLNPNNIVRNMFTGVEKRAGQFRPSRQVPPTATKIGMNQASKFASRVATEPVEPEYSSREEWETQ